MNRYVVMRSPSGEQGTFGVWTLPVANFPTLELPWYGNSPHYSCTPAGIYLCRLEPTSKWSPRQDGRLFHIFDVPGRSLIKIHAATWAGDVRKGWHSDLLGCLAPGRTTGNLTPPDTGRSQAAVLSSRSALTEIMRFLGDDDFELELAWETQP